MAYSERGGMFIAFARHLVFAIIASFSTNVLAEDAPDESLANASNLQVEQTARAEATEYYHRRKGKKLSTDIENSEVTLYAEGRAIKHGLSSSSMKSVYYKIAFHSTIEQLRVDEESPIKTTERTIQYTAPRPNPSIHPLATSISEASETTWLIAIPFLLIIAVICFSLYLLPWIISLFNNHPAKVKIFCVNFFLGWTTIGWAIALVLALTKPQPPQQIIINQTPPKPKE